MSATFFRYDGWVQTPTGEAVPGASVAVLTDPSDFSTQPGTPLATIFGEGDSNSATIIGATWAAQQLTFELSATPPDDIVPGSYISVSGVTPSAFNSTLAAPYLVLSVSGDFVTVADLSNPGTYGSGGTVATSVLPNPLTTDGNGHYFFYAEPGLYGVQVYGSGIFEQDYPDQGVGTVAGGSVTSIGLAVPDIFTVSGSPVTTAGTITVALVNESANLVFAGPGSGSAAAPTFRDLVAADIPDLDYVTSIALTLAVPSGIFTESVTGSPITTNGTLALTIGLQTQDANEVFAGPSSGSASAPNFRALVVADIPATGYPTFESGIFEGPQQDLVTALSGAADAIIFPGSNFITHAGVDATTLATPVAGAAGTGDDGKIVRIFDTTGNAHTVTTAADKIVPSHMTITFNGTIGSFVELEAFDGLWYPAANSGVAFS